MTERSESDNTDWSEINRLLDDAISEKLAHLEALKRNRATERRLVMKALNPLEDPAPNALLASDLLLLEGRINNQEEWAKLCVPPSQALLEAASSLYTELKDETMRTFHDTCKQCKEIELTHQVLLNAKKQREEQCNKLQEHVEAYGKKKTQALKQKQAELDEEAKLLQETFVKLRRNMGTILENVSVPDGYLSFDDILRDLTAALMSGQDGSYIKVTTNMWAPCVEFLLGYNIVIQHPRDHTQIRLVDFSEGLIRKKNNST